jgi:uncharacterized protein (TIGR00290 family)
MMVEKTDRVVLSWSSGKDSAWTLHALNQDPNYEVVALLTTFDETTQRVSMHGVRKELVLAQARALGIPLIEVMLPSTCPNYIYADIMHSAIAGISDNYDASQMAFGDLYLEDIRQYRESRLAETAMTPVFPLWDKPTRALAYEMISAGQKAILSCVNTEMLGAAHAGLSFDEHFLANLPAEVDPCGENGEFHTFVVDGPDFHYPLSTFFESTVAQDGLVIADLRLATDHSP